MPYDNPLNRKIAEHMMKIYERYINHTANSYDLEVAESKIGYNRKSLLNDSNINFERQNLIDKEDLKDEPDEMVLEPNQYESKDVEGTIKTPEEQKEIIEENRNMMDGGALGSMGGFAHGTFRDTGFQHTLGAGYGMDGGYPVRPFVKALKRRSKISNPIDTLADIANLASKVPLPGIGSVGTTIKKGTDVLQSLMKKEDKKTEGGKKRLQKKSSTKVNKEKLNETKSLLLKRTLEGGKPSKKHIGIMSMKKKVGRPSKMSGGTDLARPYNMIDKNGLTGTGKIDRIVGGLKPVAQKRGSSMAGQGKPNLRAEIVKQVMKERGVSMIEASKIVKNDGLYKKK